MRRPPPSFLLLWLLIAIFPGTSIADRSYTVKRGDTLWSISARELGDGKRWPEIAGRNGISSPSDLEAGATIAIPENEAADDIPRPPTAVYPPAKPEPSVEPAPGTASAHEPVPIAQPESRVLAEPARMRLPKSDPLRPRLDEGGIIFDGPLTLEQAIAIGRSRSPEIAAAQARLRAATAGIGITRADGLPQVNAGADLERLETFKSTSSLGIDEFTMGADLTISQSLFTFGRLSSALKAASALEAAALAGSAQAEATVGHAVHTAYLGCLLAARRETVAEQARDLAARLLHEATIREREGAGTRFDVVRARADHAGRLADLAKARAGAAIARENLASTMGLAPSTSFEVSGDLSDLAQPVDPDAAVLLALDERPELAVLSHRLTAAGFQVDNARAQHYPSLDASASAAYTRHDYISRSLFFRGRDASSARIGIGLSIPIFDGHRVRETVKKREAEHDELIAEHRRAALDARTEVRGIYYDLIASLESLESAIAGVEAAEESLRIAQISFREGIVSALDVIEASVALTEARLALVSAEYDYRTGIARLIRAAGTDKVISGS